MSNYDSYESDIANIDVLTQHVPQGTKELAKHVVQDSVGPRFEPCISHIKITRFTFDLTCSVFRHICNWAPGSQKLFHKRHIYKLPPPSRLSWFSDNFWLTRLASVSTESLSLS
jgi:hypothetical protein